MAFFRYISPKVNLPTANKRHQRADNTCFPPSTKVLEFHETKTWISTQQYRLGLFCYKNRAYRQIALQYYEELAKDDLIHPHLVLFSILEYNFVSSVLKSQTVLSRPPFLHFIKSDTHPIKTTVTILLFQADVTIPRILCVLRTEMSGLAERDSE